MIVFYKTLQQWFESLRTTAGSTKNYAKHDGIIKLAAFIKQGYFEDRARRKDCQRTLATPPLAPTALIYQQTLVVPTIFTIEIIVNNG